MDNSNHLRVMVAFGTRPEAIKMVSIIKELQRYSEKFCVTVCVTAQHREMLDSVLNLFSIEPDYDLNIMRSNQTLFQITSSILSRMQDVLEESKPDIVLVQGDTSTAFVVSLASFYLKIPVGHIEAGLRTNDKYNPFPEEINRRLTDALADLHFAPTESARDNLLREGIPGESIFVTGNTVIDALLSIVDDDYEFEQPILRNLDFSARKVIAVTVHRRESFGKPMKHIFSALRELAVSETDIEIVYPVHLNPNVRRAAREILQTVEHVHLIEPLSYKPFVQLLNRCYLILTDSGGIQEEAPSLGKPVLVLRDVTERSEAIEVGTARLVGTDTERIIAMTRALLHNRDEYDKMAGTVNPYGDGNAAKRIVEILSGFPENMHK